MKLAVLFLLIFVTACQSAPPVSIDAQPDDEAIVETDRVQLWARKMMNYKDMRFKLQSCGTSRGPEAFKEELKNAVAFFACTVIDPTDKETYLVLYSPDQHTIYQPSECEKKKNVETCTMTILDTENLSPTRDNFKMKMTTKNGKTSFERLGKVPVTGGYQDLQTLWETQR